MTTFMKNFFGAKRQITLVSESRLRPPTPSSSLFACSAGPDDLAITVWADDEFPDQWIVTRQWAEIVQETRVPSQLWRTVLVQPMPGGDVLLATARSSTDREFLNARIYSPSGELKIAAHIGDGIAHLQTTTRGEVWVGYFDEGVFGDLGRNGRGTKPIAASGLVRFNSRLEPVWEFEVDREKFPDGRAASEEQIADLYALNVTDDRVLALSYTSWTLLDIRDRDIDYVRTNASGCQHVLAHKNSFAFIGNYKQRDEVTFGSIVDDEFVPQTRNSLPTPSAQGSDGMWATQIGRGSTLHVFYEGIWSKHRLEP